MIETAAARYQGHRRKVAGELGVHVETLRRIARKVGADIDGAAVAAALGK